MNLLIWACVALTAWPSASALYYMGEKTVFQPPGRHLRNVSYFGYSITYDSLNKKLVISAPKENNFGEVYDCDIQNRTCTPINVPKNTASGYTHEYWFGATVKAGPGFVIMCAPRYTEYVKYVDPATKLKKKRVVAGYVTEGTCYSYENGTLKKKTRLDLNTRRTDFKTDYHLEETMDSFGWSIDVAPDNSIIVGSPSMYHGRVMFYPGPENYRAPKLIRKASTTSTYNFGYAVASGNFITGALSYAIGSPYGTTGHGEVIFYKELVFQGKLETGEATRTHGLGSMFGAVLCAANLFPERTDRLVRTDLLVGAPTYATKNTYNLGAVYVYLALKDANEPKFKRIIVGRVSGSMFGSAIINVGDLNGDKKHEIAIGAPFEKEGRGIVYLYSGAALISDLAERELKWLQRIEPEASYGESFGMSLTPVADYDQNGCNALAIGSPFKDTVVLLRCMAAVDVKTSVKFPNLQGRTSLFKTEFEFEVCLLVTYPNKLKYITALVSTTVEMDHEYAKLASGPFSFKTSLHDKNISKYCKNVSFILPLDGKYDTEVSYTISTKLLNDPQTLKNFSVSRVILSDRSLLKIKGSFSAVECAEKTCVPKLSLTSYNSFHHDNDPYIIGSSTKADPEAMYITVHNYGDVAYEPCVRVHIVGAYVLATPTGCVHEHSTDGNRIKCEPPKPIRNNTHWTTDRILLVALYSTNLDQNKSIIISTYLYNHCDGAVTHTELKTISVKADPEGIVAKGETGISTILNMTKEDIKTNGKRTQHDYTISNKGPTNWKDLRVLVTLQNEPYIKYNDTPVTLYTSKNSKSAPCLTAEQNETSTVYLCEVESLEKTVDNPKILIPMYIVPGTLDGILVKDKNVTIVSSVKLILNDGDKVQSITTTLTLVEAPVPIETIIIAVVVGLCILIIISVILYSVGFLRRKNRTELEKLKNSVKRQTILRHSTMPSQTPQNEDRTKTLEDMKEEDEHDHNQFSK